jgi:plastocyanin
MNGIRRVSRDAFSFVGLLLLLVPAGFAQTASLPGEIRGKITVTKSGDESEPAPMIDRYSGHHATPASPDSKKEIAVPNKLSEKAAVYLEGETLRLTKTSPPTAHPVLNQSNLAFHPQVLPVLVNTIVDFPNGDNVFHNVFSYSTPKEFDLGRYPTGDSRAVRFDHPGVVRVYCDIHSHMNATILVLDHPYFATPDDQGSYVIKNVPPGTYAIRLWYGREAVGKQSVTVKSGESVTVNFTF